MPDLSKLIGQRKRRENLSIGRTKHAEFGDETCHQMSWSDVEGRVPGLGPRSRDVHSLCVGDLLCIAFLNGDRVPIGRGTIDAATRGADIKRDAMGSGHERQVVGADLVGNIPIGGDTVTAPPSRHPLHPDA